jgi:hypothetical protein
MKLKLLIMLCCVVSPVYAQEKHVHFGPMATDIHNMTTSIVHIDLKEADKNKLRSLAIDPGQTLTIYFAEQCSTIDFFKKECFFCLKKTATLDLKHVRDNVKEIYLISGPHLILPQQLRKNCALISLH